MEGSFRCGRRGIMHSNPIASSGEAWIHRFLGGFLLSWGGLGCLATRVTGILLAPGSPVCRTGRGLGRDVDLVFQDLQVVSAALRAAARRTYAVPLFEIGSGLGQ